MILDKIYISSTEPSVTNILWARPLEGGAFSLYAFISGKWGLLKLMRDNGTPYPDDDTPGGSADDCYTKEEIDNKLADILGLDAEGIAELKTLIEDDDALTGLLSEINNKADKTELENVAYTNAHNIFTGSNRFRCGDSNTVVIINNGGVSACLASNENLQWCEIEKDNIVFCNTGIGQIAFKPISNNGTVRLAGGVNHANYKPLAYLEDVNGKQDTLVSGTNIKTVNSNSLLGSGDVSVGTITGITMNGESKGTSGVVDLGTVLTAHQDISDKANKIPMPPVVHDLIIEGTTQVSDVITLITGRFEERPAEHIQIFGTFKNPSIIEFSVNYTGELRFEGIRESVILKYIKAYVNGTLVETSTERIIGSEILSFNVEANDVVKVEFTIYNTDDYFHGCIGDLSITSAGVPKDLVDVYNSLAPVATSGSYNDLSDKPTLDDLNKDSEVYALDNSNADYIAAVDALETQSTEIPISHDIEGAKLRVYKRTYGGTETGNKTTTIIESPVSELPYADGTTFVAYQRGNYRYIGLKWNFFDNTSESYTNGNIEVTCEVAGVLKLYFFDCGMREDAYFKKNGQTTNVKLKNGVLSFDVEAGDVLTVSPTYANGYQWVGLLGMSITNKYPISRFRNDAGYITEDDVDDVPTANSNNPVKSGGVYGTTPSITNTDAESDLDISDEGGNVLLRLSGGHIKTKNFDSVLFSRINSDVDYDNEVVATTSANSTLLYQQHKSIGSFNFDFKWVGGCLAENGRIYGITNGNRQVLEINPETDTYCLFGNLSSGSFKWSGCGIWKNGKIYGYPRSANSVLIIDPLTQGVEEVDLGTNYEPNHHYGGCIVGDYMYLAPRAANHILKINLKTWQIERLGEDILTDITRYSTCIYHPNGYIYFIPEYNAKVLKLNPLNDAITELGSVLQSCSVYGASVAPSNKCIYGFTGNRTNGGILKIDVENNDTISFIHEGTVGTGYYSTELALNGKLYSGVGNGTDVWELDPTNDTVTIVDTISDTVGGDYNEAKCAGGVLAENGSIYLIPAKGRHIYKLEFDGQVVRTMSRKVLMSNYFSNY